MTTSPLRLVASLTLALLAALAPGVADAETITYTTTTFSGSTTSYTSASTQNLPYTNADSSTVSSSLSGDRIQNNVGLVANYTESHASAVLTYNSLPTGTTEVGFAFGNSYNVQGDYLATAEFIGNGFDYTFTAGSAYSVKTVPYMGFISSNPITEVVLTFTIPSTDNVVISSYTSGIAPPSVPEPASLAMVACGLGLAGVTAIRRRRAAARAVGR
jgi:hypothetical protein